jgi:hypothetical protein
MSHKSFAFLVHCGLMWIYDLLAIIKLSVKEYNYI